MFTREQLVALFGVIAIVGIAPTIFLFTRAFFEDYERLQSFEETGQHGHLGRFQYAAEQSNNEVPPHVINRNNAVQPKDYYLEEKEIFPEHLNLPPDCEPNLDNKQEIDPFWDEVAFVVRTGKNVAESRYVGGYLTWHSRVKHIVYVSDAETEPYEFTWRGRNISIPKMWDGVTPYAPEGDTSISNNPWEKDFVKHLGAFQILYEQHPNKTYYIMADDDTYYFVNHLKRIISDPNLKPREQPVLAALCYGIDFNSPLHSCDGKFPPKSYFTAGGAGIVLGKFTLDRMYKILPHCYEAYKTCWAGDRRLGACLVDSGVPGCNSTQYNGRDLHQQFRPDHWQVTSLHKMTNKQFLLLDWIERHADPPGEVYDDYLHPFWEFLNANRDW